MTKPIYINRECGHEYLSWHKDESTVREATVSNLGADKLAEFFDNNAEQDNMHNLVGVHAMLAEIIRDAAGNSRIGSVIANRVFRRLVETGGLRKPR